MAEEKKRRPKRLPKEVQTMVAGGRMLYSIMAAILAKVVELGGTADDVQRLSKPEGLLIIEQIARIVITSGKDALTTDDTDLHGVLTEAEHKKMLGEISCNSGAYKGKCLGLAWMAWGTVIAERKCRRRGVEVP